MTVHNLVKRNARKHLEVIYSNNIMGLHQGKTSIVPNTGRLGAHLLLPAKY